jgi:hypothetical protein
MIHVLDFDCCFFLLKQEADEAAAARRSGRSGDPILDMASDFFKVCLLTSLTLRGHVCNYLSLSFTLSLSLSHR